MDRPHMGAAVPSQARAWAVGALAREPGTAEPGAAALLQQLCRAATSGLDLAGAAVELRVTTDVEAIVAASDEGTRVRARMEFDAGEGPSRTAQVQGRPVNVPDLTDSAAADWAGWGPEARRAGIGGVLALPLQAGAAMFGVLTLYSAAPRWWDRVAYARCLAMAGLATEIFLASTDTSSDGSVDVSLSGVLSLRHEVYQAQGMVTAALGVSLIEALMRMRAHAFASGRDLGNVAVEIVSGELRLNDDRN